MFSTRVVAGQELAKKLLSQNSKQELKNPVVLGVPRGGVVVACEVAKVLNSPLDIIVTRKIRAPTEPELAVGAIGETEGSQYIDRRLVKDLGITPDYLTKEIKIQKEEIKRRENVYRQGRQPVGLKDKTVIIIDDGAATGATLVAAAREVWDAKPACVIIALPVAPSETTQLLEKEVDEVYVLEEPEPFFSVGQFYEEFGQVTDQEVIKILQSQIL
jgi:putative phosphoribosyl transferase